MVKCVLLIGALLVLTVSSAVEASDEGIKKEIIRESISKYPGNCPCPYNLDKAGRKCGKRSAYSKPGGYSPVCYVSDVTKKMLEDYKKNK